MDILNTIGMLLKIILDKNCVTKKERFNRVAARLPEKATDTPVLFQTEEA